MMRLPLIFLLGAVLFPGKAQSMPVFATEKSTQSVMYASVLASTDAVSAATGAVASTTILAPAADPKWAPVSIRLQDNSLLRGHLLRPNFSTIELALPNGEIFIASDGVKSIEFERTAISSPRSGQLKPSPPQMTETDAERRKVLIGAGLASMGNFESRGLQVQVALRDARWEAALQFAGSFDARSDLDSRPGFGQHSNTFKTSYARIRGAYLHPLQDIPGFRGDKLFPFSGYLTAGAGLGCYLTTEDIHDDARDGPITSRRKNLHFPPIFDAGLIVKLTKRNELRLAMDYAVESKKLGRRGYRTGGLGVSATISFRLN